MAMIQRISAPRPLGRVPLIIEGAIEHWPARRWSPELLADRLGTIPAGRMDGGRLLYDEKTGVGYDSMPAADWLASRGYSNLPLPPSLEGDLPWPRFLPNAPWKMRKLWLSAAGTRSPLHQDLVPNLYAQLAGRKQVTLFRPADGRHLYRHPLYSKVPNFSRVDPAEPDHTRFPRYRDARPLTVTLAPGDLLYLPRLWWHQMQSLDFSISVSHWWATGIGYWAVRAALAYKWLRALRY
jgi:hypothetical protein